MEGGWARGGGGGGGVEFGVTGKEHCEIFKGEVINTNRGKGDIRFFFLESPINKEMFWHAIYL